MGARRLFASCMVISISLLGWFDARPVKADEVSQKDLADWQAAFVSVVQRGRALWSDPGLGASGVVCAQCHPNAANTHPETYPKFQKQLGRVVALWEMANWCLRNPLEGRSLSADDPKMTALQAYMAYERRGVALDPGKH